MKNFACLILSMFTVTTQAQHSISITVADMPASPVTDVVYLAGSFNGWNPQDESYRLQKNESGHFFIALKNLRDGDYEFKFTRGSWQKGETDIKGVGLPNRKITVSADTDLQFSIAGWADGFAQQSIRSTASPQVTVIDTAFPVPQLGRTRRIWIYLPGDYASSGKKYPVLYMHDGQNLFDDATSFAGEWGVDEAMDSIKNACIVVGIDNGGTKRMTEYNPNDTKQFGKGEGRQYLAFIAENLKPFIDKKYRTLKDKQHTYMAGSSMGGLISFYAGLYYPNTFGALGVFSPAFWLAPQIKIQIKQLVKKSTHGAQKYYFYAGGEEGGRMVPDMQAAADELKKSASPKTLIIVNPQGKHNEPTWRSIFPSFYSWIR